MFRKMRRKNQLLSNDENNEILMRQTAGVLAVHGDNGYPYAVPLSYIYDEGKIYIHSAQQGHKLDSILKKSKVSFCVIDEDKIISKELTTYFRSVILFGHTNIVDDEIEKTTIMRKFGIKYSPKNSEECEKEINEQLKRTCVIKINIDSMTGKQAIELVR